MINLIKHLKPFIWSIVIIFALLFVQAMTDLALPGYMADIVNVGIQSSGIQNAVPQAIRASEYDKVTLFMSDSDKAEVAGSYLLLDKQTLSPDDYTKYVAKYPDLANEPIYILNTGDNAIISQLNDIFSKPIFLVVAIEQQGISGFTGSAVDIPEGTDPFTFIADMPPSDLEALRTTAYERITALPDSIITQSSTGYLVQEYDVLGMSLASIQTRYILGVGGLMLLITLLGAACSVAVGFLSARVASALARNLRQQIFTRVEDFSNTEFDKFSTASLITRSTNDITQVQMLLVMLFRVVFYAPILGIGGIIRVIGSEASMTWIIAAAVMAILGMIGVMLIVVVPRFRIVQKLVDKLNLVTREILSGLMVIRAFNTQKREEGKFDVANKDLTKINLFISRVTVLLMPLMMLIMNVVMIAIIWIGAHQVDAGNIQVGDMMAFMQYTMQIIMAFFMVSMVFVMLPRALVSVQRINEVLETEPVINDPPRPHQYDGSLKGQIEFKNVVFRYPGAEDDLLKDISFTVKPGHTAAIIGSTGCGKSTLVNLIPRFYDVTGGSILVDGIDVREVTQHDLRDKIGYVAQKTLLFSGTIGSNIRYANEAATDADLEKFAGTAQAMDFVKESEGGFATVVSQGGANLSGGQKQRLSIARALAKRPEIFIFDDSFSALDYTTDAALRKALRKETDHATVLIVTQRISTIMGSDQIIVLDHGEIVGIGKHRELMETCEVYREIAQSQLSKEELSS
ncbi:MAG: ABC transporter ATP-binding protein [Dehalococcoidales bacterium]|jgi:ATP-binding cassette subfamily B protein